MSPMKRGKCRVATKGGDPAKGGGGVVVGRGQKNYIYKPSFYKSRVQNLYRRVAPLSPIGKAFFHTKQKAENARFFLTFSAFYLFYFVRELYYFMNIFKYILPL